VNVTLFTVNPPEIVTVAPLTKPVPVIVKVTVCPFVTVCLLADVGNVMVGAAFTVKQLAHEPLPASGLVTVTFPAPVVALEETVMFAVSEVEDTKVVEFTVIPLAENVAAAPLTKPVPVIVMFWFAAR
jgi:hypothetical protein